MTFAKDDLIEALRLRYDHYSARSVFELARERANLADKPAYEAGELRAWRDGLAAVGDRVGRVLDHVDALLGAAPAAPAAKPAAKPAKTEPAKTEPAKTEPAKAAPTPIEATIVLTGVEVGDGEQVLVCGALPALGDWDPERARPMARSGAEWRATVTIDAGAPLAFKFLRRSSTGTITWESGDDRTVPAATRVEATWR